MYGCVSLRNTIQFLQNKSSVFFNNLHHSFDKSIEIFLFINLTLVLLFRICGRFNIFHLATSAKQSGCMP